MSAVMKGAGCLLFPGTIPAMTTSQTRSHPAGQLGLTPDGGHSLA